jgi:hypothetical protein
MRLRSQLRAAAVEHQLYPAGKEVLGPVEGRLCREGQDRAAADDARE